MPTMKLYQNGTAIYMGGAGTHQRAPRGKVVGWSSAAARRQRQWAWTVDADSLNENGISLTLTMGNTPENARVLHTLRRSFIKRVERMGLVYGHWVIEWQERGTPHFHMALYFDHFLTVNEAETLLIHWIQVASKHDIGWRAQDWNRITGAVGWLKYLAKHATRGVLHYQRQGMPEGWTETGRLWGSLGQWPVVEPYELPDLSNQEFYRVRRLMRAWAFADARKAGDRRRMAYLKRMRQTPDKQKSRFFGAADWIPMDVSLRLVDFLERENVGGSSETASE